MTFVILKQIILPKFEFIIWWCFEKGCLYLLEVPDEILKLLPVAKSLLSKAIKEK